MVITDIYIKALEDFYYDLTKDFAIDSKRLTNINTWRYIWQIKPDANTITTMASVLDGV